MSYLNDAINNLKPYNKIVNETSVKSLPKKFKNGQEFMDFVYNKWPSRETHVEMQGQGAWSAEIDGDDTVFGATFDEGNKFVSWQNEDLEEIEEAKKVYPCGCGSFNDGSKCKCGPDTKCGCNAKKESK